MNAPSKAEQQELESLIQSMEKEIAGTYEAGVGSNLFVHFQEIKDAFDSRDWWKLANAIYDAMGHVLGREGMHAAAEPEDMKALPWIGLIVLAKTLFDLWRGR
jgi:hypothetical protein